MKNDKMSSKYYNKGLAAILAMALFNFIFLGAEYLFDNMMRYVVDSEGVVMAQSYILGASAVGFLLFGLFHRLVSVNIREFCYLAGTCIIIICIFLVEQHTGYVMILTSGLLLFTLMGILGSGIHYFVFAVYGESRHLGKMMGTAYAIGVFFQFVNNNLVKSEIVQALVLSVSLMCFVFLFMRLENAAISLPKENYERMKTKDVLIVGGSLITCVIFMTCIFSTLDIAVTMVHAEGSVDIGQWPRLLLAVSGLTAGILYDVRERCFMSVIMYCVTLLSTICVVVIQMGGPFPAGLIVFYLSAGFFVVFFTVGFMDFAKYTGFPKFWAGIGRAVNNLCAILTSSLSVILLDMKNGMALIITTLVLFVGITISIFIYHNQLRRQNSERVQVGEADDAAKFVAFSISFSLTEREQEVLKVLLHSDDSVQEIAEQLLISRAALYRHITSLNEKTQTKTRIGLMQFYYSWRNNAEIEKKDIE